METPTFEDLKQSATESTKFRGHSLSEWDDHNGCSFAKCLKCGKQVTVLTRPLPNDINIGGEAVALGCLDPSSDTLLVPYLDIEGSFRLAMEDESINPAIIESILSTVGDYVSNTYGN